ncbi:MAG: outer membrane protein assembly factor BamD [Oceanospirillaceae bacterium]|nr:outer membrane protein assembly factor BamD [Oceanospirillaceae bacterium]
MSFSKVLLIVCFCALTSACSLFGPEAEKPDIPENTLYLQSIDALKDGNYPLAVEKLELLEARYPFGQFSQQAQLELIYAYYKNDEPDAAIVSADRFVRLNPAHENVDYAYYLKGLAAFEQTSGWLEKYLPIDENQRDPGAALESFDAFAVLVGRYPDSQYAVDANKRMLFLKNRLATHEVQVAQYYMERGAYIAAANRGRYVVENYQETLATPRALELMYQAYTQLKLDDLAADSKSVLAKNFPNYSIRTYESSVENLLSTVTFGLLGGSSGQPPAWTPDIKSNTANDAETKNAQDDDSQERSWLNRISFGLFN